MQDIALLGLVSSRLCHDLIGPTSAVVNGLELITAEPDLGAEALQMVVQSAEQISTRLQFYRSAYGVASGLNFRAAQDVARTFFREGRVVLAWDGDAGALDAMLPQGSAKLALNLLLLGADILGKGGRLEVSASPRRALTVNVTGEALRQDLNLAAALLDDETNPRTVQPVLVALMAKSLGGRAVHRLLDPNTAVLGAEF